MSTEDVSEAKPLAQDVCKAVAGAAPHCYVITMAKTLSTGRMSVDCPRNVLAKTQVRAGSCGAKRSLAAAIQRLAP